MTFVESTRRLSKKEAAGEAAIQKVTISHVGGRWQESALERYLFRYHVGQCFHKWFSRWCFLQDVAGLRPETKNADPRTGKTGMRSLSREASGCIRFESQVWMCLSRYIYLTKLANLGPVVQALEVDDLHIGSTRCMGKECGVERHTEEQEFRIARSCA